MNKKNQANCKRTTFIDIVFATLLLLFGAILCLGQYEDVALSTIGFLMTICGIGLLISMKGKKKVINHYFE